MKIALASDHGGFELKKFLKAELRSQGYSILDFGNTSFDKDDDYPDYVLPLAKAVASGEATKGIAVCGSGVGACIAANKVKNARACLICDTFSAHQGVEDDNMNILCLGGRITGNHLALDIVKAFLSAGFSGGERHLRRIGKFMSLEEAPHHV